MNFRRLNLAIIFILIAFCFSSCAGKEESNALDLGNSFYWAVSSADESVDIVGKRIGVFTKFNVHNGRNIARVAGSGGAYIWLRSSFIIPNELKEKPLGFVIPHLSFAGEVYINGNFVGMMGVMPPKPRCQNGSAGFFTFPEGVLNQHSHNIILIKVWCAGRCSISEHVYLTDLNSAKNIANRYSSYNSRIYLNFQGGVFAVTLLFFLIFIQRKKDWEYFYFSLINLATILFIQPFYAWEMPWFLSVNLPYDWYSKLFCCIPGCLICYFIASFIYSYEKFKEPKTFFYVRTALLIVTILTCLLAPNYKILMNLTPYTLFMLIIQAVFGFSVAIYQIAKKINIKQNIFILCGFLPIVICVLLDIILKDVFWLFDQPYYTIFGWQGTIIYFLIALTVRFTKLASRNEYLNNDLSREVKIQTQHLSVAMEKLESEKKRADMDMEMAAIVQQKFFPYPNKRFRGWDIATSYSPVSKVSGDLYDYYNGTDNDDDGVDLRGFSLFDVSGHGISSGLITMLSKNIIFRAFRRSLESNVPVNQVLYQINDQIIDAKGDIENYLTGLMFRIGEFNENDECKIEFANAGHPSPIFFSAKSKIVATLDQDPNQLHYGAIGIKDIAISFPEMEFTMGNDDIIVCYTDGLTEAMNSKREEFGIERVMQIVRENYARNAQSILEAIIDGLYDFLGDAPREDDMTIMVLKREDSRNFIEEL